MKFLLETIFSLVFFAIFIWALPAIIGIFSLGLILYSVCMLARSPSGDSAGKGQEKTYKNYRTDDAGNENYVKTDAQYKAKTKSVEPAPHYSGSGYSHHRYYDEDDYVGYNDSYYNDWEEDMPPEDEIDFRGTGAPFL